jgi:flagellar assembly factor FliW
MPVFQTARLGAVSYPEDAVLEFPRGLPGFEGRRLFVAVQQPATAPLVFLQSLEDSELCFTTTPAPPLVPDYQLEISAEDLETVGLPSDRPPAIGVEALCLAVLAFHEGGASANLLAPIVVNLANRKAVQAVSPEGRYSHRHEILAAEEALCS